MANTKVTGDVIANGTISTVHLADDAITAAKLDSTATGITFADLTVDTDTLYVDAANNRVGIGTTSPTQALHVDGVIYSVSSGTDGGEIRLANSGGGSNWYWAARTTGLNLGELGAADGRIFIANGGNVGIGVTSGIDANLRVDANSATLTQEILKVKGGGSGGAYGFLVEANNGDDLFKVNTLSYDSYFPNGKVGIGITSPATVLDVRGSGANTLPATTGTTPSTGTRFRLASTSGASAVLDFGISTGGKSWLQATDRTDLSIEYPFLINPNGGSVGIGTASPTFQLSIENHATTTSTATMELDGKRTNGTDGPVGEMIFSNNGDTFATVAGFRDGADNSGSIVFQTQDSGTFGTRMTISSDGNVGIGTISPAQSLDTTGKIRIRDGGNTTIPSIQMGPSGIDGLSLPTTNTVAFITNSTERMRIDSLGDVTIQTSGADDIKNLTINSSNGSSQVAGFVIQNDGANGYIHFKAGAGNATPTTKLTIGNAANSGNVGIGTSSPVAKFEVTDGSSSITLQEYSNGAAIFLDGVNGDFIGGDYFHILADGNSYLGLGGYAGGSTPLNISNSGNVGIGATSPLSKFDLRGTAYITGYTVGFDTSPQGNYAYRLTNDGANSFINVLGGNLGIGTTNPQYGKLQIKTASAIGYTPTSFINGTNLRLTTGGTAATNVTTGVSFGIGGAAELYIGAVQNSSGYADAVFQTYHGAYGERMRMTSDGKLGIGITTPQVNLQVNGSPNGIVSHFGPGTFNGNGTWSAISLGYSEAGNNAYRKVGIAAQTKGDGAARQDLHFLVDTASDSSSIDIGDSKMSIQYNTGDVIINNKLGIGTTLPDGVLHVIGKVNTNRIVSGNLIMGNIRSNLTTTTYLLLVDLNVSAGFSLVGELNAASYTTYNVSRIYVRKNYNATTGTAVITGIAKSGSNLSVVDISHSSGRFIAIKLTGDPEIDVMWTGYRLNGQFNSDGTIKILTSGVTENSVYASY